MSHPTRLAVALALLLGVPPAAAQEPPAALVEATEDASALCTRLGGTPTILDDYVTTRDLNGDGRADFVTDFARLECAAARSVFCGPSGCPVTAWLSEPDGGYVRFELGRMQTFQIEDGTPLPSLVTRHTAASCGTESHADCTRTWTFTSNAPDTPPIDPTAPEATPAGQAETAAAPIKPLAVPSGWTLRRIAGASPMALGGGTGNIASLAAFCLAGQPFLAVTFQERPAADAVTLAFAFSQGEVEASAGFEETAGGTFVVPLAGGPLAGRLSGRDSKVAVSVDGTAEGVLSLSGSTRAFRGALEECPVR